MIQDYVADGDLNSAGSLVDALEAYKKKTIHIIWLKGMPHATQYMVDEFDGGDINELSEQSELSASLSDEVPPEEG